MCIATDVKERIDNQPISNQKVSKMDELLNKPLFQCTLGDFKAILTQALRDNELEALAAAPPKKYVYGLAGLMKLFGCSISTAERIKQSGVIDQAISQTGDIIVVDAELALDLLRVSGKHKNILSRKYNNYVFRAFQRLYQGIA